MVSEESACDAFHVHIGAFVCRGLRHRLRTAQIVVHVEAVQVIPFPTKTVMKWVPLGNGQLLLISLGTIR